MMARQPATCCSAGRQLSRAARPLVLAELSGQVAAPLAQGAPASAAMVVSRARHPLELAPP